MGRNSKNKPIASDSKLALNNSPEIYCGKSPSGNQIDEALRLFKETIPSNEVTEAAQMEKLERDIDEIFGKP